MTEKLLQFIWQFQYFNRSELRTEQGELLQVLHPGTLNTNQGPDFAGARVRVADTTWAGNIELHILTSDWHKHAHQNDPQYKNIVLHVVWKNDEEQHALASPQIPTLELQSRVSVNLLQRYEVLMNSVCFVPCENVMRGIGSLTWVNWKERLLVERLQRKSTYILGLFTASNNHWEETFWWMIARNFGVRINAQAFESIAQTIPVNMLAKYKTQIHQLEALLFGQAGLLECKFDEDYPQMLQREFRFLKTKYSLKKNFVSLKFLRMRPSAFPSIRLAQLAMLVCQSNHLFSKIKDTASVPELKTLLNVTANDYWHYHYRFDEKSDFRQKKLGAEMVDNIIINTIVPVLFAYGLYQQEEVYKARALGWLHEIAGENNSITKGWQHLGVSNDTAFDSQALIQLKSEYCDYKRCLDCAVGNALLRESKQ